MELQTILPGVDMQPHKPLAYFPSELVKCGECGETVPFSEGEWIDREFYCCMDCAENDGWITCDECCDWVKENDCKNAGCNTYCETCFDDAYIVCECCNSTTDKDSAYSIPWSGWYCEECFHDHYGYCGDCGEVFTHDELTCYDCDTYCETCIPNPPPGTQRNYTLPTTFDRVGGVRYGVELEYNEARCDTEFDYFENGTDHCGREFRSGILIGDGGLAAVRELAEYAENNGWDASDECGFHLHLDCRGLSSDQLKSIAYGYYKSCEIWEACVHPSRDRCGYAYYTRMNGERLRQLKAVQSEPDFKQWASGYNDHSHNHGRYQFFNWRAYDRHKTIEVRGHEGTCNAEETCNWISAHTRFFDYVKDMSFADIDKLFCGMLSRDFTKWTAIVGKAIGTFYKDKAGRHGNPINTRPMVHNRTTPLTPI